MRPELRTAEKQDRTIALPTSLAVPFHAEQLPFFCRQEYKFEQQTRVAFRLRLGSLEQCNFLEGKSGTHAQLPQR